MADNLQWNEPACLTRRSQWLYLVSMSLTPRKAFYGPRTCRHRWWSNENVFGSERGAHTARTGATSAERWSARCMSWVVAPRIVRGIFM